MRGQRPIRPADAVAFCAAVLALALAFWFGWSEWSRHRAVEHRPPVLRAIDILRSQIEADPDDILLRMQLAQAYTIAGADREAAEEYQYILSIDSEHVPAVSGLGFIASRQKDWKASERYWRRALELISAGGGMQPGRQTEMAAFYLGTAQLAQQKYAEAVVSFKEALRFSPTAPDTHYQLAIAYRGLGDEVAYRESLQRALESDPTMPEANYDYALVLLRSGDRAGAAEHFRCSAEHRADFGAPEQALQRLGPFAERVRAARDFAVSDPARALAEARIAVALDPRDAEALVLLGELYEQRGDKALAEKAYRSALDVEPRNAEALSALADLEEGNTPASSE